MRIKATKTSLYKLVAEYITLPPMNKVRFTKAYRSPSYWLEWSANGIYFRAYLSTCGGGPLLSIEAKDYDEESGQYKTISRVVHKLTVDDLRGRGMIEKQ